MAAEKKSRRIKPAELLEMLDLEERKALASEIGLTPPENLNDRTFASSIAEFSATTLLRTIVGLRSPIIEMVKEVYQFLEKEETRGRTTVRAVVLPGAKDELQILFNPAMKEAIATILDRRIMSSSIDSLEEQAEGLKDLIINHIGNINGTRVRHQTSVSRMMRAYPMDPMIRLGAQQFDPLNKEDPAVMAQIMAQAFDMHRTVYHPRDRERVLVYAKDFEEFVKKFDSLTHGSEESDWLPAQKVETVLRELQEGGV